MPQLGQSNNNQSLFHRHRSLLALEPPATRRHCLNVILRNATTTKKRLPTQKRSHRWNRQVKHIPSFIKGGNHSSKSGTYKYMFVSDEATFARTMVCVSDIAFTVRADVASSSLYCIASSFHACTSKMPWMEVGWSFSLPEHLPPSACGC